MDERWLKLVRTLYEAGRSIPVKELTKLMDLAVKTIKNLICENDAYCTQYGFTIQYSFAVGYKVEIHDTQKFAQLLLVQTPAAKDNIARMNYIISRLVQFNGYLKIEDLANELYVSRATIDRLMPDIKIYCNKYDLQICNKAKYGICLEGSERNKRYMLRSLRKSEPDNWNQDISVVIQKILLNAIQKYNLLLNDINFHNLVQHCVIAISRVLSCNLLEEAAPVFFDESIDNENNAAHDIIKCFEEEFNIQMPKGEEQYLVMHLLGKRVLDRNHTISEDILQCINEVFDEIKGNRNIDLSDDIELRTALALHIQPLIFRLKFGLRQDNPMLMEIKREMNQGFELALCASNIITQRYQLAIDEDEVGYLALHFAVALERRETSIIQKKIVVVCASGRGTAKLIQHRLISRYHFKADDLIITSALMLDNVDFSDILCILTTIPLQKDYPVPTVLIDMIMNQQSFERVDKVIKSITMLQEMESLIDERLIFDKQRLDSKEDILAFLCEYAGHYNQLQDDFHEQIIKRESLGSTEVGNEVALPHPYEYKGKKIVLSFLCLEKPVMWKYDTVRLVILMALPAGESELTNKISDAIVQFVGDKGAIRSLTSLMCKRTLLDVLFGGMKR